MPSHQRRKALQATLICVGCEDHVAAARAGHLRCLGQLCEKGLFLPLDSPDWASAGEARKSEVFEAAIAGCSSGHAAVLAWLFSSGWPSNMEAAFPLHMQDLWEQHEDFATAFPELEADSEPFVLEYQLYCCAVQQPTPSCLEALLDAGCCSEWICCIAAREGKADFLALAAKRGCPCDFWVWDFAAITGKLAVLELLASDRAMQSIAKKSYKALSPDMVEDLTGLAASHGQWECLQILQRAGCKDWDHAVERAASTGHLECLRNLVQLHPGLLEDVSLADAAGGGNLACLKFLEQAGRKWEGDEPVKAAGSGSSEALRFCLQRCRDRHQPWDADEAMLYAIMAGSPDCMQALYDFGYQRPPANNERHPAQMAISFKNLACLRLALQLSGPPKVDSQDVRSAAEGGEELLQIVHRLRGCPWARMKSKAAEWAALEGQAGALRYALQHGAPLSMRTIGAAVEGGSVECLRCVHEHALIVGFPAAYSHPRGLPLAGCEYFTLSFKVLRYVCEVMRPAWVHKVLSHSASSLANSDSQGGRDGWKMRLYTAKRMEGPLPRPLDELVRVRRERARALGGVFYKAKRLARAGPRRRSPSPSLGLWRAMDRLPPELRERIAFEAHLVCPEALLGPL
eukprot:jgi/Botrbrau1/15553/Bobra.0273s0005.1